MKTLKNIVYFALSATFVLSVAACGDKGGGGGGGGGNKVAAVPTPKDGRVVPDCSGCPTDMAFLDSAMGIMLNGGTPGMELALSFFGDPATLSNMQAGGLNANVTYAGPVAATGRMVVMKPYNLCGVPPGEYEVETVTPGYWYNKYFFNQLQLVAHGPAEVHLAIYGWVTAAVPPAQSGAGETFPFRMQAEVQMIGNTGGGGMYLMPCRQLIY